MERIVLRFCYNKKNEQKESDRKPLSTDNKSQ